MKEYNLLTAKPVIFAANVTEDDLPDDGASNKYVASVREFAAKENCEVFVICAQIEQEISELDDDEKKMFLEDLGISLPVLISWLPQVTVSSVWSVT